MFNLKIFFLILIFFLFSFNFLLPVYSKDTKNKNKSGNTNVTKTQEEKNKNKSGDNKSIKTQEDEKRISAENYFETGESFYISKNYQMAIEPFQTAIGFYPNYLKAHERLVDCLVVRLNSFEDAVKFYQKKIDASYFPASDDRSGFYFGLGLSYLKSKTPDARARATEFFNKSLKINNTNKCAMRIVEIAKKENLKNVKRPPTTLIQDYKKNFFTYGAPVIVLLLIFNIYKLIRTILPEFRGFIFVYNMQGDKILDEPLRKFRKSSLNSISIGSNSSKNGIVIPGTQPVHVILKSEKFLRQARAKLIPHKDGQVFLFLKQKNNKGNETGATFTVPFEGGYLYDKDIIKIGDYFMQYIDPNVSRRPQEDVYDRMPALRPKEDDEDNDTRPPEVISVYKDKNIDEPVDTGAGITINIPHEAIPLTSEETSQKTNGYVPAMFRDALESNSAISIADEDEEIAIDIHGEEKEPQIPLKKVDLKPKTEEIIPELLLFMGEDEKIDDSNVDKKIDDSNVDKKTPVIIKEESMPELSETPEVKTVKKKVVKKLVKKKVDTKKEPLKAKLPLKKEVKEDVKEELKEEVSEDENGLGFWGFSEDEEA